MRLVLSLACLALVSVGPLLAAESVTPPAAGDSQAPSDNRGGADRFQERMYKRLAAEHPELKDVDPSTPAGQEKFRAVMEEQMRKRMSDRQAANIARIKTAFAMKDDEFAAIEPLLTKVENLRQQKMLVDPPSSLFRGGPGGDQGNRPRWQFNPASMLGADVEPSVKEVQEATKALKTLIDDPQANATELTNSVTRIRKAREAFQAVLGKAQEDLRAVLSPRQEAILIEQGTLE
jgi:hypothetical protein